MGLERQLIQRYVISYVLCVLLTISIEHIMPVFSLSLDHHLYLSATLSLAWQGVSVSTSGLEQTLSQLGWSVW